MCQSKMNPEFYASLQASTICILCKNAKNDMFWIFEHSALAR